MRTRDWALVAFTVLMQASIGTVLVTAAMTRAGAQSALDGPLAAAAIAGGLALAASLFHLGHPAIASLAITNVRASWVSREIVLSLLFVASTGVLVLNDAGSGSASWTSAMAAALGVSVIYAMSRLYMVPAQPAWNRPVTPLMFVTSGLVLGAALVLAGTTHDAAVAGRLAFVSIVLVVVQSLLAAAFVRGLRREPAAAISVASAGSDARWLTSARVGAAAAAVALLALMLAMPAAPASALIRTLAFAFVLLSEVAGRLIFYRGRTSLGPL